MSNLLRFWPTAQNINDCIGKEAETLSDAVLLAVHRPMKFHRESLSGRGTPVSVSENELLQEFLTEDLPSGNLLLPIVGSSGIGKSHAIRWLDAQLRRRHDHASRHIILIPKSASLREVLRLILKDLNGPVYDDARYALQAAPDDMDDLRAREELRAKLLIALERRALQTATKIQARRQQGAPIDKDDQRFHTHAGAKGLQAFLSDPVISPYFVQRSLAQIAHRATAGLQGGVDPKTQFEEEDLQIAFKDGELDDAATPARIYYRMISRDTTDTERVFAVKLLNEVVDDAIAQMMKLDGTRLSDIFTMIREQLLMEGKELVLLVEDFAAMAGIQGSLLDAMIKEAIHGGEQVRCTMRTALAVTAGYLANRDTVSTRARFQWVLEDIPTENDDKTVDVIVDFVGGYLNAARCGRPLLEQEFRKHSSNDDLFAWIPCFEERTGIEDEDRNTLDAFGRSSDDYSLFPFNRMMIEEVARIWLTTPTGNLAFNPRTVINYILWDALREYRQHFETGSFPPSYYLDFNPSELDPSVNNFVRRMYPDNKTAGRYLSLMRFWGGNPNPDAIRIPERVYQAFGLQTLPPINRHNSLVEPTHESEIDSTNPERQTPSTKDPIRGHPADRYKEVLQAWATGNRDLGQMEARRIRTSVVSGLKAYISWDRELCPTLDLSGREPGMRVYIPRARGGSPAISENNALVTVTHDSIHEKEHEGERNEVVLTLLAILRLHDEASPDVYQELEMDIARYANFMEKAVPQAIDYVQNGGLTSRSQTVPAVSQALLIGARILGLEQAHRKDDVSLLATMFRSGPPVDCYTGLAAENFSPWERLRSSAECERKSAIDFLISEVAARQGEGRKVYAVDAIRLLQGVKEFLKDWRVQATPALSDTPPEIQSIVRQMSKAPNAVRERISVLKAWRKRVEETLGSRLDGDGKRKMLDQLKDTLSLAEKTNTYPYTADVAASTLREWLNNLRELPIVNAVRAVDAVADEEEHGLDSQLTAVSAIDDKTIQETDKILRGYDNFLQRCGKDANGKLEAFGSDLAGPALEKLKSQILEAGRLAEKILEIASNEEPTPSATSSVPPPQPEETTETPRLLESARELERSLRLLKERMEGKQLAAVLKSASDQLEGVLERARQLSTTVALLVSNHLMQTLIFNVPGSFQQSLNAIYKRLLSDPVKITEGKSFERIIDGLNSACDGVKAQCESAWRDYVARIDPKIDTGFLSRIIVLGQYQTEIERITSLSKQLQIAGRSLPLSSAVIVEIEQWAVVIRDLWQQLPSPDVHKEVQVFLDAIKQQSGAPLNMLTPQVLFWLEAEGLIDSFCIQCSGHTAVRVGG